jgi:hypothetical protein
MSWRLTCGLWRRPVFSAWMYQCCTVPVCHRHGLTGPVGHKHGKRRPGRDAIDGIYQDLSQSRIWRAGVTSGLLTVTTIRLGDKWASGGAGPQVSDSG